MYHVNILSGNYTKIKKFEKKEEDLMDFVISEN